MESATRQRRDNLDGESGGSQTVLKRAIEFDEQSSREARTTRSGTELSQSPHQHVQRQVQAQGPKRVSRWAEARGQPRQAHSRDVRVHRAPTDGRPGPGTRLAQNPMPPDKRPGNNDQGGVQLGQYFADQIGSFLRGLGTEVFSQVRGILETVDLVVDATLVPNAVTEALGGAIESIWKEGSALELGKKGLDEALSDAGEAWATIGSAGTSLLTYLRENSVGKITKDILNVFTNYRGIAKAIESGDRQALAAEIGRASVRICELFASALKARHASRGAGRTSRSPTDESSARASSSPRADESGARSGKNGRSSTENSRRGSSEIINGQVPTKGPLKGVTDPDAVMDRIEQLKSAGEIEKLGGGGGSTVYKLTNENKVIRVTSVAKPRGMLDHLSEARRNAEASDLGVGPKMYSDESVVFGDGNFSALVFERFGSALANLDVSKRSAGQRQSIATSLGQKLGKLHAQKILHGDLNPANVLIKNDTVRLTDFETSTKSKVLAKSEDLREDIDALVNMATDDLQAKDVNAVRQAYLDQLRREDKNIAEEIFDSQ